MGVACGDLDGDGRPDLLVTNFYGESTTFFRNLGGGMFADQTAGIGLAARQSLPARLRHRLPRRRTTTAASTSPPPTATSTTTALIIRMPCPSLLMIGGDDGRLIDVSARAGAAWSVPRSGPRPRRRRPRQRRPHRRAHALPTITAGLFPQSHGSRAATFHHFDLAGTKSNRDGVGAVVTVTAGGKIPQVLASRRRQLPVGLRSRAPFRTGRRQRTRRPGRGALAVGPRRPLRNARRRSRLPFKRSRARRRRLAGRGLDSPRRFPSDLSRA